MAGFGIQSTIYQCDEDETNDWQQAVRYMPATEPRHGGQFHDESFMQQ